jgi:polysaccharide export outer membrane protein
MRLSRSLVLVLVLLLAALALGACARLPSRQAVYRTNDIDALMYGGATAPSSRTIARVVQAAPISDVIDGAAYLLDSGDKLRIVVFGQDTLSNTYTVDAAGVVTMPLIGAVNARGVTTAQLSGAIAGRLRANFIRDPSVAVEVDVYRPFFVLGEVTFPGQYPYVPNMTVENAIAIAGGFTPRAVKDKVTVTRKREGIPGRYPLPLRSPILPGDSITVGERWF